MAHNKLVKISSDPIVYTWTDGDDVWELEKWMREYRVTNHERGWCFKVGTLKEAKDQLPKINGDLKNEGFVHACLQKTAARAEADRKARPYNERLRAADKYIVEILTSHVEDMQQVCTSFKEDIAKCTLMQLSSRVQWAASAVRGSYILRDLVPLLDELNAGERRAKIIKLYNRRTEELIEGNFLSDSTGAFYRATQVEHHEDAIKVVRTLKQALEVYEYEYVTDVPEEG